jgi:hypothetical protein
MCYERPRAEACEDLRELRAALCVAAQNEPPGPEGERALHPAWCMSLEVIKRLGAGRGRRRTARQEQEERGEVRRVHYHGRWGQYWGRQLRTTPAQLHGCNKRGTLLSQLCGHVRPVDAGYVAEGVIDVIKDVGPKNGTLRIRLRATLRFLRLRMRLPQRVRTVMIRRMSECKRGCVFLPFLQGPGLSQVKP